MYVECSCYKFKMEKNFEQCVTIKCCAKFDFNTAKMFEIVKAVYSEPAVLYAAVACWHNRFRERRELFKDEQSDNRPTTTKTDVNMARVAAVVKKDHRVGCQMMEEKTGIPKTIQQRNLHDDLKKWKICARFVLHALTVRQHDRRVARMHNVLEMVKNNLEFLDSTITRDESWCFA